MNTNKQLKIITSLMCMMIVVVLSKFDVNAADYSQWSAIFDPAYYTAHYADAASYAGGNVDKLWEFFTKVGIPRGDQASAEFNVFIYAKNYPDLVKAYGTNYMSYYIHYATKGKAAGLNAQTVGATSNTTATQLPVYGDVQLVNEYVYKASYGMFTEHIIVVKNVSNKNITVSATSNGYDAYGSLMGCKTGKLDVLAPGATSVIVQFFENGATTKFTNQITTASSKYYKPVNQQLTYTLSKIPNGVVANVANTGLDPADFVKGYAIFFKGNECVYYDYSYFTDDSYEIKPGAVISEQLSQYGTLDYDRVEFYLDGRK